MYQKVIYISEKTTGSSTGYIISYKILSGLNDETICLGIATGDPVPATWSSTNTIVYRPYNGGVYHNGNNMMTIEKSHYNDIIKFIFSPQNANLKILKVHVAVKLKFFSLIVLFC